MTTFRRLPYQPADLRRTVGIEHATRRLLLGGVMPLWLGAGLADWYLHRRSRIEDTSGPRESAIHSLMFAETGVPVLLGLFCRRVTPIEQHVHSLLEVSPIMATFLLTALHWDQAKALTGQDRQPPRFRPRPKRRDPLTASSRVTLLAAIAAFGVLPYAEEFLRCWRANPRLGPVPEPDEPATDTLRFPGPNQVKPQAADEGAR